MRKETRIVCYDDVLQIEAYRFMGIMQQFPNHFHEHYVAGFIEEGSRRLACQNQEYIIFPGHVVLFNPYDNHTCSQTDEKPLDYRCLNIPTEIMQKIALEITGKEYLPHFSQNVTTDTRLAALIREMHRQITKEVPSFQKEETFLFLMEQLIRRFCDPPQTNNSQPVNTAIQRVCDFLDENYQQQISLEMISELVGLSKYHLLRTFTREKGISPYRYLENIRINEAKKLLANGTPPVDAALMTGFTDQSHFTNHFKSYIGLTPGRYKKANEPITKGGKDMDAQTTKCVMVIDEALPLGIIANTAAILGYTLGKQMPQLVGPDVYDADGQSHMGIIEIPIPILRANSEHIKQLRETLFTENYQDIITVDFTDVAQGCVAYPNYQSKMASTPQSRIQYFGIALCGSKKKVNKLTGSMPLLR